MADTTEQECKCCDIVDDCIDGLCQSCNTFRYEKQKQIDLLTLGLLQEKTKASKLLATIKNALTSCAIIAMPVQEGTLDVATNEDLLNIMADSFKTAIAETEKGT